MNDIQKILSCQFKMPSLNIAFRFYARLLLHNKQQFLKLETDLAFIRQYEMHSYLTNAQKTILVEHIDTLSNEILRSSDEYFDFLGKAAYSMVMDNICSKNQPLLIERMSEDDENSRNVSELNQD